MDCKLYLISSSDSKKENNTLKKNQHPKDEYLTPIEPFQAILENQHIIINQPLLNNLSELKPDQLMEIKNVNNDINEDIYQISTEMYSDLFLNFFTSSEKYPIISDEKQTGHDLTSISSQNHIANLNAIHSLEIDQENTLPLNERDDNKVEKIHKIENILLLNQQAVNKDHLMVTLPETFAENAIMTKKTPPSLLSSETFSFQNSSALIANTTPTSISIQTQTNQPSIFTMPPNIPLTSEAWQQQLNQQLLFFSREGISHAQLRLYPEELGLLNVHLHIEDNQAVMHFISQNSHVRSAMETMMPLLRSSLQENGVHLAQSYVGEDFFNNDSNNQSNTNHDKHHHRKNSFNTHKIITTNIAQNDHIKIVPSQLSGTINTFV